MSRKCGLVPRLGKSGNEADIVCRFYCHGTGILILFIDFQYPFAKKGRAYGTPFVSNKNTRIILRLLSLILRRPSLILRRPSLILRLPSLTLRSPSLILRRPKSYSPTSKPYSPTSRSYSPTSTLELPVWERSKGTRTQATLQVWLFLEVFS